MASELELPDLMVALQQCWCTALQGSVGGAPADCCWISGEPVVADCCAGYAWVRLISAYPTLDFPSQDTEARKCPTGLWAAVVEVGIARCAAKPCGATNNVCCESELDAALIVIDDFARMRKMLTCCVGVPNDSVVLGNWQSGTPEGGCLVSSMRATFRWTDSCPC